MSRSPLVPLAKAGLAALPVLAAAHAAPVVSTFGPLRNRWMPRLSGHGRPDHVALTFDDGPDPLSTPLFLRALEGLGVKATFFVLGSMARRSPGLLREMAAAGHEIGVHGWHHRPLLLRGPRATHDDFARARDEVAAITGERPSLFRPPYGVMSAAAHLAARRLGLTPVLWTAWGEDWTRRATAHSVYRTVAADLRGGATVLLHDSDCTSAPGAWRSALGALPMLLDTCVRRGLEVGPLREHGQPWAEHACALRRRPALRNLAV
ncbi:MULTISPECIES: polysaccharide deacetylase family protein [Streptomycetaceae]|uniref:Polysaccharide deacetylase n=1 Tax=Streptantibioticus cattleyicolor (strain ATCC 35852 / DSM 46488 / JCM 4925 / NBRC 14057 / NRRL 8057) TaxID=1003195 RepID=F8JZN4_STREN|nr:MULTISPECIES: polysaccharide deacetylase family protein [Streptomycetaceae]AEW97334.1 polysaccharide deacetylase [Streptantibioticus cattleyicolor NRRL 8057 = DSM 46488]MYS61785.1 polysaccharide deacetylase family protein [Streptomyces sp. SID5468]CCB77657.1 Predicted xylanase/chitin deacetylase [Streptantibioticus cattleyicolor NRRL 8057 = DSM 46488]